jgi:hypothetical protein
MPNADRERVSCIVQMFRAVGYSAQLRLTSPVWWRARRCLSSSTAGGARGIDVLTLPTWKAMAGTSPVASLISRERAVSPVDDSLNDRVALWRGDLTQLRCDAIVNAANAQLKRGGGVCGRIHAEAGPELAVACNSIGHCATGYDLPAG